MHDSETILISVKDLILERDNEQRQASDLFKGKKVSNQL